ncbi:MAG: AmmeMemoRadiSam system protein B [Candidatus Omnitrophota bacterium]|nr:AmmeMemoRadiSam system protein B [Candidatus Omnitrophota bacterium]
MIRKTVVAGQFYPGSKDELSIEIKSLLGKAAHDIDAIGAVSPHAGYIYSGHVAGRVFASMKLKSAYIIMGPNHTGLGEPFGIDTSDSWKTPLGETRIDTALAEKIKKNCKYITADSLSHAHEHSIEVQLPFLQFLQKDFKFVPITISHAGIDIYREIGAAIAKSIKEAELEKDVTIIASSDMTHYESRESARKKDFAAINAILALDEEMLAGSVSSLDISMCGCAPVAIMIASAKALGAKEARLVKYQTSGDVSGDYSSVVGYAGMVIK